MSEMIHNGPGKVDMARQHHLSRLIKDLHQGRDPEDVKREFKALFASVSSEEIATMEAALVAEGMPIEEIQRLCDIHAAVMGTSVAGVHGDDVPENTPGHPLNQLEEENKALEGLVGTTLEEAISAYRTNRSDENSYKLLEAINTLTDVDKHYLRKENLIFPFLESAGITAPPKVMWGVHDEIRADIKKAKALASSKDPEAAGVAGMAGQKVTDMIFKERNILYPMMKDALSEDDWIKVERESDDIGYSLVAPKARWTPARAVLSAEAHSEEGKPHSGGINLQTGVLTAKQLELMLNTMPVDVTFIDADEFEGAHLRAQQGRPRKASAELPSSQEHAHSPEDTRRLQVGQEGPRGFLDQHGRKDCIHKVFRHKGRVRQV